MSQQAKGCRNCGTAHRKISLDCAKRKSPKKANVAGEDNFWGFLKIRFLETVRTKPDVVALQEISFNYIPMPVWAVQWPERISWDFVFALSSRKTATRYRLVGQKHACVCGSGKIV